MVAWPAVGRDEWRGGEPIVWVLLGCVHVHDDAVGGLVARADAERLLKLALGGAPVARDEEVHPLFEEFVEDGDDALLAGEWAVDPQFDLRIVELVPASKVLLYYYYYY